jgi:general secretion pathway protein K
MNARTAIFEREKGFVLVAVLWILAALTALASSYSTYVANSAIASKVKDDRLEAEAAITSSLELTAYNLISSPEEARPKSGELSFRLSSADVTAHFISESARADINAAPKDLLAGLFRQIGVDSNRADFYTERIIAWRQKWTDASQDLEPMAYKSEGLSYSPREGPFQSVMELSLVRGIPSEVVEKIVPLMTVYNGSEFVDPFLAPPEIIASLPGMTPQSTSEVLAQRTLDPTNNLALFEKLGPARARVSTEIRKAIRIFTQVRLKNNRRVSAETVIFLRENSDEEPYKVLYWQDDFDGLNERR